VLFTCVRLEIYNLCVVVVMLQLHRCVKLSEFWVQNILSDVL
jgi:hypothetical protein